ncbi:hypothetical protein D1825_17810 [Cellulomonas rhizosphaerae]|uniref:SCP domain-containing protein n=1 Tax=Cellulomonas rhizosphaerae TaxID=2293719 RepID=A0A413RH63_9CELL|nr:hypothetical protein D1825_17810 [Cellulomonas rhizosphaerae]
MLRAVAVIVAVVGVVAAAALAGRGDPSPTVEPPVADRPTGPAATEPSSAAVPGTTSSPTPSPSATASATATPTATRSPRPSTTPASSPTRTPKATAKPRATHAPKAAPEPTRKAASPQPTVKAERAPQSLVDEIVTRTNAERTKAGLPALKVSSCAAKQAAARTKVLVEEDRFEHDPLGPIVEACGIGTVGENLALGYPTAKAVVAGWMGSAGHKANILGEQYTKIGVGCTKGPKGQLCAQVFLG